MTQRFLAVTAASILVLPLAGCGDDSAGVSSGSCAFTVIFDGRGYTGSASPVRAGEAERGARIGTARDAFCDDTPNDGPDVAASERTRYVVHRVVGEDPAQMIWAEPAPGSTGAFVLTRVDPAIE